MLDVIPFVPDLDPMTPADLKALPWKGATEHIGPVANFTPLQKALLGKTNCALYLIYTGCVGLCIKRLEPVMPQDLSRQLVEQIYAYQFDWRYPKLFDISIEDVDSPKKEPAIRLAIPYFFFRLVERMPTFFLSSRPLADVSFMINLTRHLGAKKNAATVDRWVKGAIARLNKLAPSKVESSPSIHAYPSRTDWEAAARLKHGAPLPLEVLDLAAPPPVDLAAAAARGLDAIRPDGNPLLATPQELAAAGFTGTPYRAGA